MSCKNKETMASQIAKVNQSLTTAEEMRNQTRLVMQPYANWEEYLTPAPLSIAIMGELVFISSQTDFSINKNPPKDGYMHIRYPDSFRACLMQVCNSGWGAFNEAHKNMDQIRLHTMAVPDYMKSAVKILFHGDDEVVQVHLPDQLKNISTIADECVELATATERTFTNVINIIQELLEACINAEHFYGEEVEEIKKKLTEAKLRKKSSKKQIQNSEKLVKSMEAEVKDAQESYKKAMDFLPTGWDMIGMDLAGSVTESFTGLINGLAVADPGTEVCEAATTIPKTDDNITDSGADEIDIVSIYCKSAQILKCAEIIQTFVKEGNIEWKNLYDQKNKRANTDFLADQFKRIKKTLDQNPNCAPKEMAQGLCEEGIKNCEELGKYAAEGKCEEDKTNEMIQKIRDFNNQARCFDSKSKNVTKSPSLIPKPPMISKAEKMSASQNARFQIEQSRAQLNTSRERYDKSVEKMNENQKELTEILITMRNCEVKEIDFNTTIKMLLKGMDAMGRVKQQWEKMVRFFQMVSNIVKTSLNRTLNDFVSTADKTQALSYNAKLFSKDLLYTQAFQATNISNLVHMISGTYTEVSDKYLMDPVSSLGKLMAMDKEKKEFETERQQLRQTCDKAQKGILKLVLKNKDEFEMKSQSRIEKIDKELLAILPSAAPEEMKSIQEAVQKGFTEEEEAGYI